jgi:hypothetical protein
MSRTKLLVRFSCQNLCIGALGAEPIQWTFWFAFDTHNAWSYIFLLSRNVVHSAPKYQAWTPPRNISSRVSVPPRTRHRYDHC